MTRNRSIALAAMTAALVLASTGAAFAHQHRPVGPFETTVGWLEEPAFVGFRNAVTIRVERVVGEQADHGHGDEGGDAHGDAETKPVENAELKVEVIFGEQDGTERIGPFDLEPAFGSPGEYRAYLIPTQPGTYTFHITGTVGNVEFDEYYTSGEAGANDESEGTYHDIRAPQDIQFPSKAPSDTEMAEQLDSVVAVADSADSSAGTATILAIVAIVLAVLSGIAGMAVGRKKAG